MPRRSVALPSPVLIETQSALGEVVAACRSEGRFAFDTEFVMEDRFEAELCLVQLATPSVVAVVDPLSGIKLDGVWELVCDEGVETIVHAGQEDLGLCVQQSGKAPRNVFDVQVAAGLCGYEYPLSLQRLAQAVLHVRLRKSKTLVDWRQRPLTAARIAYGAEDVGYLPAIHARLTERLRRAGRCDWAREEFGDLEDPKTYRRAVEDVLARVKGAGSLRGQALAVVRELLVWRESFARQVNRPARAVLKDHLLVEIARQAMTSAADIRELRGINLSRRNIEEVASVVQQAQALPPSSWPEAKANETEIPHEAALVALATAVVRSYCHEHHLAYSLVATQRSIRELIRFATVAGEKGADSVELLRGWRGQSIGKLLEEVLAGRRAVHVERTEDTWAVHISPHGDVRGD